MADKACISKTAHVLVFLACALNQQNIFTQCKFFKLNTKLIVLHTKI